MLIKDDGGPPPPKPTVKPTVKKNAARPRTVIKPYKPSTSLVGKSTSTSKSSSSSKSSTSSSSSKSSTSSSSSRSSSSKSVTSPKPTTTKPATATTSGADAVRAAAERAVALVLNPKLAEIKRQQQELANRYNAEKGKLEQKQVQNESDIKTIYGSLDEYLKSRSAEISGQYDQTSTQVGNNYDQFLQAMIAREGKQSVADAAESQRLGLDPATSQSSQDAQWLQGLAQINKANAATLISSQKANALGAQDSLQGAEQGRKSQFISDSAMGTKRAVEDMATERFNLDNDLNSRYRELESQRSSMVQQYMQEMEQQAYERAAEARQQEFMNSLALNKFNLSANQMAADQAYRQQQLDIERAKLTLAAQQAAAKQAGDTPTSPYGVGRSGAATYLNSAASGTTKTVLSDAFQHALTAGGVNFADYNNRPSVLNAMRQWLISRGYNNFNTNENMLILADMFDIYHGKYS